MTCPKIQRLRTALHPARSESVLYLARPAALLLTILTVSHAVTAAEPASPATAIGWRLDGSGQYPSANPPTKWSTDNGVLWKTEVGMGTSSPILVGTRVFVTAEPDLLICLDARSGKELWRKAHKITDFPAAQNPKYPLRASEYGNANATPVSDGSRVWATFGTGIVACYNVDGKAKWVNWYDMDQTTEYARTASPLLIGQRLVTHLGPLACLDAATGKLLWQNDTATANYGTPAHARIGDVDIIITPTGHAARLADGKTLASDLGRCQYTTPLVEGRIVYFLDTSISAVQLPESATDTFTASELWYKDLRGEFFASGIVHDGRVYAVNRDATCFVVDARTGTTLLERTLDLPPAGGTQSPNVYPSLCLAGKHLFIGNDTGDWLLMAPGEKGTPIAMNSLPHGSGATPAFDGPRIYLRGGKYLFCIAPER